MEVLGTPLIMDNFTSCEEYVVGLKTIVRKLNITPEHFSYHENSTDIWKILDLVGDTKVLAYAVIMIGGFIGNLSVILTVALIKSVRNTINFYVTNLAVADAIICFVCMLPHALSHHIEGQFIFGAFMCKFTPFAQTTCLTCSVLTLCAISCDRFMAVFRPLQVRTTVKHTRVIIVVIWIISMAVSLPFLIVKTHTVIQWPEFTEAYCLEEWPVSHYLDEKTNLCVTRQYSREIFHVMLSIILFFLPVLIMFAAYSAILYKLWSSKIPGERSEGNIQKHSRSKQKVLKMVIVVLIVFVICWTPLQVIILFTAFGMDNGEIKEVHTWYNEFEWFSYYIAYANSFMNPFIYGQFNSDFRNGFCTILCCRRQKRRTKISCGENVFTKSLRSMNTKISSLRSSTQAFISRRISKSNDHEIPETAV